MRHYRSLILVITLLTITTTSVLSQKHSVRTDFADANPKTQEMIKPGAPANREKEAQGQSAELISATTYGFTATTAALENMTSGTTLLVGASSDDTASAVTNIGFDFWMDGVRFTQFSVNANGLLVLGATVADSGSSGRTNDFATTTNNPKISAYWDDMCTGGTGKVHFKVIGSPGSRRLVVEWLNMVTFGATSCTDGLTIGTYQVWINESSSPGTQGVVQLVQGALGANSSANGGYSIGMGSSSTSFASITSSANSVSYAASANAQTNAIAAANSYILTPNVPLAPGALPVSGVTPTGLTLNWTDNATNEVGYAIYRSTDGVNYTFRTQTAANATSFADTGLAPSTNYFYNIYAVTEGALSSVINVSTASGAPGNISCAGAGGLWSAAGSWSGGVPTSGDNVTIGAGCTITIDTAAAAVSVTVQSGGLLQFEQTTARTLTTGGNVTIDAGGTIQSNPAGTVTTHILSVGGNLTNNGTLDFSTNADTAAANITFSNGVANATFGGTGATTDVRTITVNKGVQATVVELNTSNFTVRGVTTDVAGFLTLTSGTFKISGTFTVTNRVFPGPTYTIPLIAGFWLNNPNFTVAATASGSSTSTNGLLRVTQGTYNIGIGAGDQMRNGTGSAFTFEGGTINVSGAFDPQNNMTYTQSGGTLNVGVVGNTVSNFGTFELFGAATVFNMSGGTINIINPCTGATKVDYRNAAPTATTNITGGLVTIGGAAAPSIYNAIGQMPSITVNATHTLRVNNSAIFMRGSTVTNNGTIDYTGANARFDFASIGAGPMTYGGTGVFGTLVTPAAGVGISANSLFSTTLNAPIIVNRVNLFQGGFINSGQITLGNGAASTSVVQTGSAGLTTPGGTFDVSPVHNQGTGGEVVLYAQESVMRTTGFEVNPTRVLNTLIVSTTNNVTISGGDILVTAALTLTDGVLFTGNTNTLIYNGTQATETRTNGYVDGTMGRNFTVIGSFNFFVGQNGFTPVLANITANARPADTEGLAPKLTVRSFDNTLGGFSPSQSISRNWQLEETGNLTADLAFTYLAADVNGVESDYRVYRRNSNGTADNLCAGGPCVNTGTHTVSVTGVTAFSRWTAAELITPSAAMATISGRVLTSTGMPIANVKVVLNGGGLEHPVIVNTGTLGYYNFENLTVGQNYVVTVKARRFFFSDPTHLITLQDNILDSDFVADPNGFRMK